MTQFLKQLFRIVRILMLISIGLTILLAVIVFVFGVALITQFLSHGGNAGSSTSPTELIPFVFSVILFGFFSGYYLLLIISRQYLLSGRMGFTIPKAGVAILIRIIIATIFLMTMSRLALSQSIDDFIHISLAAIVVVMALIFYLQLVQGKSEEKSL